MFTLQDLGVAREEAGKLQESLRLMGDEVTTAERAQSRATAELAAVQRMLRWVGFLETIFFFGGGWSVCLCVY